MKDTIYRILFYVSIVLFIIGLGLLIWLGVGQFIAQIRANGEYVEWKIIKDVSLWGFVGIPCIIVAFILFITTLDK